MKEYDFFEIVYRIINKYNAKTKKPKYYGTEHLLYSSEIHMIEIIGKHHRLTSTEIANLQGITKGAVSQTTSKLFKKGIIQKAVSPQGNNEILIGLTEMGKTAFEYHLNFHNDMIRQVSALLCDLPQESIDIMKKIVYVVDNTLDTY